MGGRSYAYRHAFSVVTGDDAGKRRLRTDDVDGVGLAAEQRDSGQFEAGLTGARDIEVELVTRSRDRVRAELEARRRGVHRQTRNEPAEIDIDVERRNIGGAIHESHAGAIRHRRQIVVAEDQRLQRTRGPRGEIDESVPGPNVGVSVSSVAPGVAVASIATVGEPEVVD